jgi:hypothetical protein
MANPTPLDFESIGAERQAKIKELQAKNTRTLNDGAPNPSPSNTFSTLDVKAPTAFDNFTSVPPTGFNQIGVQAPPSHDAASPEHFGHGALKVLGDVRQGTVKDITPILRPLAFPFYKAGQGVLAGLEWSGNVATTATPHVVEQIQNFIPGKQNFEKAVTEKRAAGLSQSKAVRSAWEEHHGSWELPFKMPFFTTAFTPNGSITIDFQDVIETGFNPVDLALTFGTGGFATGGGIAAAAIGRQSAGAGLKIAVTESIGVRGIKGATSYTSRGIREIPNEIRTGGAGTRSAIAGLPSPSSIISNTKETANDVLHPRQARERRAAEIRNHTELHSLAPGVLAQEDMIEQISTKDWRFENVLNKIPELIRGEETTRRYKAISGLGQGTFDRIIKLADPSAVVGNNTIALTSVMRENIAARLANQVGLGLSYIDREILDMAFKVNQFGRTQVDNIKLTPEGTRRMLYQNGVDASGGYRKFKNSDGDMVDMNLKELQRLENEGFMLGDLVEGALSGLDEKVVKSIKIPGKQRPLGELQAASIDITFGAVFGWDVSKRLGFDPKDVLTHERIALLRNQEVMQRDRFLMLELDKATDKLDALRAESGGTRIGYNYPDIEPVDVFPRELTGQVRSRANSLFTGLTPDQSMALERFHKYTKDWLELAEAEGAIEVVNGKRVGFRFGPDDTADLQEFGEINEMYRYAHREAISKDSKVGPDVGDVEQIILHKEHAEGFGSGRGSFTTKRMYETMEEGARDFGTLYAHPMEAAESMAITLSQMIADKRAMKYLKEKDIVVTSVDAFERMFPRMTEDIANITRALKSAEANVRRLTKKSLDRKSKKTYVTGRKSTAAEIEREILRNTRQSINSSNQAQRQMIRVVKMQLSLFEKDEAYQAVKKAYYDVHTRKEYRPTRKELGKALGARNNARKAYQENRRLFNERVTNSYKANDLVAAAGRRQNTNAAHVQEWKEEVIGITDDLTIAHKEVALLTATWKKMNDVKSDRMKRIASDVDINIKAFGNLIEGVEGQMEEISHFKTGPLAGAFAPESHAKELQKTFGDNGIEALRQIEKVTGTARTLAAGSADIGWMGIQGSLLAATHPVTFAKAAVNSLEAILQPAKRDEYVRQNLPDIIDFLQQGGDLGSSEFFTAIDRTGSLSRVTNWLTIKEGKIPMMLPGGGNKVAPRGSRIAGWTEKWGRDVKPIGRLGAGFNTFVDISKVELWKSFNPMVAANVMTRREVASYINNVMGTLNTQMLGVRQTQRQIEGGVLLFSPRFTRSAFAVTGQAMKTLTGGAKGAGQIEGLATREAVKSISGMVAASTTLLGGYAMATGQWEEFKENGLNPMKPGWLTVKVGGVRVGVGGSTRSLLDTIFKSAAAMAELDGKRANDLMQWNIFDPLHRAKNPIPEFWLNRQAPMVRDFLLGQTFEGEGLDTPKDYVIKGMAPKFAPFAMQEFLKPDQGQGSPSLLGVAAESSGLRARPLSIFERRAALRDELSKEGYGRKWEQLDVDERKAVQSLDRDNRGRLAEMDELVAAVESPTVGQYFLDRKAVETAIDEQLHKAANSLKVHGNGATFREEYDNIMREARNSRKRLDDENGIHAAAIKYLERKREARLEGETLFNQIFDEYVDNVKNIDNYEDEVTGLVDWDKKDIAEKNFEKDLMTEFGAEEGATLYTRMKNNYVGRNAEGVSFDKDADFEGEEIVFALRDAREALNSERYWQVARDIIGADNPTMLRLWNTFEMSDPLTQEAMKRQHRQLTRIQRQVTRRRDRIRKNNPAIDRALMNFYGHRAKNRGNVQLERAQLSRMRQGGLTQTPVR